VRTAALRVVVVDRPDAPQSVIQFAFPGVAYGAPDRHAFAVALTAFGGSFTSRLNDNLREKRGYTYGARARADYYRGSADDGAAGFGVVAASAAVQAAVTGPAVREFLHEFGRMKLGDFTTAEVEKAKAGIANGRVASCETLEGLMGDAAMIANFRLPLDRNAADLRLFAAVDVAAVNEAGRRRLIPDGGVLAVAGDRRVVLEGLAPLGLPAPEIRTTP
jgi:predicted Zn-dependent peptidase